MIKGFGIIYSHVQLRLIVIDSLEMYVATRTKLPIGSPRKEGCLWKKVE